MRASLSDFSKLQLPEKYHDFARLENRRLRHELRHFDGLSPDELALESGLAFLKEHLDDLLEVRTQLVERFALAVRARKPRYPPDIQTSFSIPFYNGREVFHGAILVSNDPKTSWFTAPRSVQLLSVVFHDGPQLLKERFQADCGARLGLPDDPSVGHTIKRQR